MAGVVGVGEKSIEELRKLAQYFPDATEYVSACATHMKNVFDENVSVLGPHTDAIEEILKDIESDQEGANKAVMRISQSLNAIADSIEEVRSRKK